MSKKLLFSGIILSFAVIFSYGQNSEPSPTPVGRTETAIQKIRRQDRAHDRIAQQTYANLYGQDVADSPRSNPKWRAKMVWLYRKPNKKETTALQVDELFREKYAKLLQDDDTGIFKIIPDQGCDADGKIVNASPNCLKYPFPGAGSSYSFRLNTYRIRRLADITLFKNTLTTRGIFNGAIYVTLGDIPIENVGLNTSGIKFLSKYKPAKNSKEALDSAKRFARGVKKDGHIYGRGVFATKENTFAMRSIAYRGKFRRSENGVVYNELDFDKRRDIIVTFRVVDLDADGTTTIVWKILRNIKSPKLKIYRKK